MPLIRISDIDKGGLWEMGIMFPVRNPNMERFEQFFSLYEDIKAGGKTIKVVDENNRIKINSLIYIGPSTDTIRENDGTLPYYGNYEVFKIAHIYTSMGNILGIIIEQAGPSFSDNIQNDYLAGDNVTIRTLPESWDFLKDGDIDSIQSLSNPMINPQFEYSREDSLDGIKGYSQRIRVDTYPSTNLDMGIIQTFEGKSRFLLNRIKGSNARMSTWLRTTLAKTEAPAIVGNDIDENIAGAKSNDIDEGTGLIQFYEMSNPIDENKVAGAGGSSDYMTATLRSVFYSDVAMTTESADYSESPAEFQASMMNSLLYKIISIPENTLAGKFAVYCRFSTNPTLQDMEFYVDDALIEHCIGTSKENDGFYKVDMNPVANISITNRKSYRRTKEMMGTSIKQSLADPSTRLKISTTWKNKSGYFINDMKAMEAWNKEGFPIVLRTKTPGILPYVLLCNMSVGDPNYIHGRSGTNKADIKINFEEITT